MAKHWERTEERGIYRRLNVSTGEFYPNLYARFAVRGKERFVALPATKLRDAVTQRKKLVRASKEQPFVDLDRLLHGDSVAATTKGPTVGKILERYKEVSAIASADHNINAMRQVLRRAGVKDPDNAPWNVLSADTAAAYKRTVEREAGRDASDPEAVDQVRRARELRSAKSLLAHARSVLARHLRPSYRELGVEDVTGFMEGNVKAPSVQYEVPPRAILERIARDYPALEQTDPGAFVGFLIGLGLGLRNKEAANAEFSWLEKDDTGVTWLRLTTRANSKTKNERTRFVEVPQIVLDGLNRLRGVLLNRTMGVRVSKGAEPRYLQVTEEADRKFLVPGTSPTDRYNALTRRLAKWLRARGLDEERYPKAYYELRKLLGSIVARREKSVFAAAQTLGNLPTTAEKYYVGVLRGPSPLDILGNRQAG